MKPLCIDIYCGLGGWSDGFLSTGWDCVGFDIERHVYGEHQYPGQLVLQDARTLHGSQFKDAQCIVASPPCQEYSYFAMPWTRAKQIAAALRGKGEFPKGYTGSRTVKELTALFDACFRIQREASEAAGHHIPMVVENVCGAQPWVGRAKWHHGSYYLWGDVPALMPTTLRREKMKRGVTHRGENGSTNFHQGKYDDGVKAGDRNKGRASGSHEWTTGFDKHEPADGFKSAGMNWSNRELRGQDFTRVAGEQATKNAGGSWFNVAHNTTSGTGQNPVNLADGVKQGGEWFADSSPNALRSHSSKSTARKAASARIAKIPLSLSSWIAHCYFPAAVPATPTEK